MSMTRREALGGLAATFSLAMPALAVAALPEGYPADYAGIIEAAAREGSVTIYTSMETEQWQGVAEIVRQLVPNLRIDILQTAAAEAVPRYLAEKSGRLPTADLINVTDPTSWIDMMDKGEILPYASPEAAVYPAWSKPHPGLYTVAADPMMFMWNKALLLPQLEPTGFADFVAKVGANPAVFRNKIATYTVETAYGYSANDAFLRYHGEKAWPWYEVLAPVTRFDTTGGMIEKVTSGEYLVAYFMGAGAARLALKDRNRARLLGLKPISDGCPLVMRGVAATQGGTHPNAAKLVIDALLSRPGQIGLGLRARTPIRPDVRGSDVNGELTLADVTTAIGADKLLPISFDRQAADNTRFAAFNARYRVAAGR